MSLQTPLRRHTRATRRTRTAKFMRRRGLDPVSAPSGPRLFGFGRNLMRRRQSAQRGRRMQQWPLFRYAVGPSRGGLRRACFKERYGRKPDVEPSKPGDDFVGVARSARVLPRWIGASERDMPPEPCRNSNGDSDGHRCSYAGGRPLVTGARRRFLRRRALRIPGAQRRSRRSGSKLELSLSLMDGRSSCSPTRDVASRHGLA